MSSQTGMGCRPRVRTFDTTGARSRTLVHGVLDPRLNALRLLHGDDGADERVLVVRVALLQSRHRRGQLRLDRLIVVLTQARRERLSMG